MTGAGTLGYRLVDADNHYYEPRDCFTRHIDAEHRDRTLRIVRTGDDAEVVLVGDRGFTFLDRPFRDKWVRPGGLREMLRAMSSGTFDEESGILEPVGKATQDRDARLALMDEQGVEAIVICPTLGVCVEHFVKDDVELTYAMLHAFNRWLDDDWGFAYRDRIYAPPLMSLLDVDRAVEELDWALGRGARVVHLRPGPQGGRSPADPVFDPFWARLDEAEAAVAFHISESGYNELFSVHWGEAANPSSHRQSAFQWTNFYGDRPIIDTMAALVFHNLFGRFPNVKVMSLENGSLWVPYLMKVMDKMKGMGRNGPWPGGRIEGRPSEILRRHVWVSPYHEEDLVDLAETIGPERVLFGSDYPHAEGLAEPHTFADALKGLTPAEIRMIMRDNALEVLGR